VAIDWGNSEGHLRVGIDREILSISATSVSVRFHFWVGGADPDSYAWNDDMTLKITGSGGTATVNFHKSTGTQKVNTRTLTASRSLSGGPTWSVSATISGAYNGATPSQSDSYTVPAKAVQPPNPPWVGGIDVSENVTSAGISWGNSTNNNGATVDNSRIQVGGSTAFITPYHDAFEEGRFEFVDGLTRASDYYVRIKMHNSAGWGDWSGTKHFVTEPSVPGLVAGRSTSSITSVSANMEWAAPTDTGGRSIIDYTLRWRAVGAGTWNEIVQSATNQSVSGLIPGTQYEFQVRARNSVGSGSYQDTSQLFTTTITVPSAPSRPGVAPAATSCAVFWATPAANGSTITGYQVQYSLTSTFGSPTTETVGLVTSHILTGLSTDTGYYVRVRATTSGSPGAWSPAKSFTTDADPTPYPVIRFWDGTDWVRLNPTNYWDGTDFLEVSNVKYWNGTAFVDLLMAPY
jgi:hypothetical protein